jgi:hypothetical protein
MSDRDPARLFDDVEVDDAFKAALREAADPGPNPEQLRRMAARLGVVPAAQADALVSGGPGRKLWIRGLVLTLPVALGAWWWSQLRVAHDEPAPPAREPPVVAAPAAARETAQSMEEPVEPTSPAALSARPSAPRPAQTVRPKRAGERAQYSDGASANPLAELALLRRARAALRGAPERALQLIEQHRQEYGRGLLAEERELLATEALMNLGRVDEARARGRAFERAFPSSAHARRLHVILSGATP